MRLRLNPIALALLTATGGMAHAEIAPDAGQSMREIQSQPLSLPPKQTLELNLPAAPDTTAKVTGPTLQVNGFTITGNTVIADDQLLALLVDLQNRVVSLGELQAGAARITALYRQQGYPLARAYLPAQEIDKGVVSISVLEGQYGQVRINNQSRVRDGVLQAPLSALDPGTPYVLRRWSAVCCCCSRPLAWPSNPPCNPARWWAPRTWWWMSRMRRWSLARWTWTTTATGSPASIAWAGH